MDFLSFKSRGFWKHFPLDGTLVVKCCRQLKNFKNITFRVLRQIDKNCGKKYIFWLFQKPRIIYKNAFFSIFQKPSNRKYFFWKKNIFARTFGVKCCNQLKIQKKLLLEFCVKLIKLRYVLSVIFNSRYFFGNYSSRRNLRFQLENLKKIA